MCARDAANAVCADKGTQYDRARCKRRWTQRLFLSPGGDSAITFQCLLTAGSECFNGGDDQSQTNGWSRIPIEWLAAMLFEIDHLTRYSYSAPVQLGEHLLRFLPAPRATQRPGLCQLEVQPVPCRHEHEVDAWGNPLQRVWFQGETDYLEICAHLEVETLDLQSSSTPGPLRLPVDYGAETAALAAYLKPVADDTALQSFVQPLLAGAASDGLAFLTSLNKAVHGFYRRGVRLEGAPRTPEQTLALGEGVCRDLAVLFMAACRRAGVAARFVSGYQRGDGTRSTRYLHAWPEVYLPASGWRGYDPTHATLVGTGHVAVAAAPLAGAVTPVEGGYSFSGPAITSTLQIDIRILDKGDGGI